MSNKTWRDQIRPYVADIIKNADTDDVVQLKRILRDKYPFAMRYGWVYKVWLDEVNTQLGTKKPKRQYVPPNQINMFNRKDKG